MKQRKTNDDCISKIEHVLLKFKAAADKRRFLIRTKQNSSNHHEINDSTKVISHIISNANNEIDDIKVEYSIEKLVKISKTFPSEKEMNGAVSGLFLLHQTYQLNWTELVSDGLKVPSYFDIDRLKTNFKIYSKDLEVLGKIAYKRKYYDQAYELLKAALHLAKQDNDVNCVKNIELAINMVIESHDEHLQKYGTYSRQGTYSNFLCPAVSNVTKSHAHGKNKSSNNGKIELFTPFVSEKRKTDQFHRICRGERLRNHRDDIGLKSFYLHQNNPFLRLGPFRLEDKNKSPYVAVFHQFFHPKETNSFINYASPDLQRSETFLWDGNLETTMSRTTKQAYAPENATNLPEAGLVSDRVNMATKLNARFWPKEESEEWQVSAKRIVIS